MDRALATDAMKNQSIAYSVILVSAGSEALRIAAEAGAVVTVTGRSQCPPSLLLQSHVDGLPKLPGVGYRIRLNQKPTPSVKIAAEIVHELLVR